MKDFFIGGKPGDYPKKKTIPWLSENLSDSFGIVFLLLEFAVLFSIFRR